MLLCSLCHLCNCCPYDLLVRPGRLIHNADRRLRCIATGNQTLRELFHLTGRQENDHGSTVRCKQFDLFFFRYRGTAFHTGQNHCLADIRQRILGFECRGCTAEGRYTGNDFIRDLMCIQDIHLLTMCAIDARVTSVQAHDKLSGLCGRDHNIHDFLERHGCAVINLTVCFAIL